MPKVIFLPNEEFCPEGMVVDAAAGDNLLEVARASRFTMPATVLVPVLLVTW